jgi:hypothetical protein
MIRLFLLTVLLISAPPLAQTTTQGIVYFSFDNARTWENTSTGLPEGIFLSDIAAAGDLLFAATKRDGIFKFDLQQNKWSKVNSLPKTNDDVDVLCIYEGNVLAGTGSSGVFLSRNGGHDWIPLNKGLGDLTIRKFFVSNYRLFVGTNGGLFSFDKSANRWNLEFDQNRLQVNGITEQKGNLFIGTNKGAFVKKKNEREWTSIIATHSLHNISSDGENIYALAYSELFVSSDLGRSWRGDQSGMPKGMYTFHVVAKDGLILAAQWDGVYLKTGLSGWRKSTKGMPDKIPVTELATFQGIIVAASSQWVRF